MGKLMDKYLPKDHTYVPWTETQRRNVAQSIFNLRMQLNHPGEEKPCEACIAYAIAQAEICEISVVLLLLPEEIAELQAEILLSNASETSKQTKGLDTPPPL